MAIVIYECDRCQRIIQLPQNQQGLEVMGKCIITESCHGNLIQQKVLQSYKTGQPTAFEPGLSDWVQRRVLFTGVQDIKVTVWSIEHDLGVNPAVEVYTNDLNGRLKQADSDTFVVTYIDTNNLTITFTVPVDGIVQCIARSTAPLLSQVASAAVAPAPRQLTTKGILTIAVTDLTLTTLGVIQFLSPTSGLPLVATPLVFSGLPSLVSPWGTVDTISMSGVVYKVKTVDIQAIIDTLSIPDFSPWYFASFSSDTLPTPTPLQFSDVQLLLSNAPFATIDKDLVEIVPSVNVSLPQSSKSTIETKGELYVLPDLIKQVYPPIKFQTS